MDIPKKKILYIWKSAYPWDVRVDKFCNSLANKNYEVKMICKWEGEDSQFENINGLQIYRAFYKSNKFSLPIPFNTNWEIEIKKVVIDFKPDLLIVREILLAHQSSKLAQKYNIPIILDMAENYPAAMRAWKKYNSNILSKFIVHILKIPDILEKNVVPKMNGIIVVCNEQKERLEVEFNFKNKISLVYNTPKSNWINRKESHNKKVVFGHHGSTTDDKKIINFLKGFIKAKEKHSNIELHLAGYGESFEEILNLIKDTNSGDFIKYLGKYEHDELSNILNSFDYGILPYQISDFNNTTVHNKIFDFFAYGKPVLVSKAKPIANIVNEERAGIVVDCEDIVSITNGISELLSLDYKELSKNAINAFETKYNWENDERKLLNFINEFC